MFNNTTLNRTDAIEKYPTTISFRQLSLNIFGGVIFKCIDLRSTLHQAFLSARALGCVNQSTVHSSTANRKPICLL